MSTIYQVIYSSEAYNDLYSIYLYLTYILKTPDSAKKRMHEFHAAIKSLSLFPERYELEKREPWKSLKVRRLVVHSFNIFFIVNKEKQIVNILRIMHSKSKK